MNDQPTLSPKPSLAPSALPPDALRWHCPAESLPFDSTAQIEPVTGVIGQESAVESLRFGLEIDAPGQNIFVRGLIGTGRMTLIRRLLEEIRPTTEPPPDRCYVRNFAHPDRPRLITLPYGRGRAFQRRVEKLIRFITRDLATALSSESLRTRWSAIEKEGQRRIEAVVQPFDDALRQAGLTLVSIQAGPVVQSALFPLVDGKPVPPDEFDQLHAAGQVSDEDHARFHEQRDVYQDQLGEVTNKVAEIRREYGERLTTVREQAAGSLLRDVTRRIEADFPQPAVHDFLEEVIADVIAHRLDAAEGQPDPSRHYQVSVLLLHNGEANCPIIIENTPTMVNLLGSIDRRIGPRETSYSDHLMIRAGSLLRADGGFLIMEAREVLREPGAWKVLVRTLRTGKLEISPPDFGVPWLGQSLKPEPIDVNIKVILVGSADTYYILDSYDPDFPHLFKVLADFDSVIERDEKGAMGYGEVIARMVADEKLLPFSRTAIAALVEHGARIAARQGKLSARFGRLADIAREASYLARKGSREQVTGDDVRDAIRRTKQRADLPSRRFRELLADGTIRVQTTGRVIGQINGLAVLQAGPLTYGFPARITATIGPGTAGVVNIDTEAALSGAIHTKGFYILRGLLRHLLRTYHPLTYHASMVFEQSYGEVDGDSASGAEICCLLSALTDVPLRQDLAMTGAIDQHGHILPIGAVNEKIEGFFDTCNDLGLTGTQGVIIPKANAGDLMLRQDVVDAAKQGKFAVYAADTIHEALELFTGMAAGAPDAQGQYKEGTLLALAVERAFEYWVKASRTADSLVMEDEETGEPEQMESEPPPSLPA